MIAELGGDHVAHLERLHLEGGLGERLDHGPGAGEEVQVAAVFLRGTERIAGGERREEFVRLLGADLFLGEGICCGRGRGHGLRGFLIDHLLDAAQLPGGFFLLRLVGAGREQNVPGADHRTVEHVRAAREQLLQRRVRALLLHERFPLELGQHLGPELLFSQHHRREFRGVVLLDRH